MHKRILNNLLELNIKRKNKLTNISFFSRLIFYPDMIIQSFLCFLLNKLSISLPYQTKTFWGKRMKIILPEVIY